MPLEPQASCNELYGNMPLERHCRYLRCRINERLLYVRVVTDWVTVQQPILLGVVNVKCIFI
jgi:hypothetical protein